MSAPPMHRNRITRCLGLCLAVTVVAPAAARAQWEGVDAAAVARLKTATDFLAAQTKFSVDTESNLEVVLVTGQKLEYDFAVTLSVVRPNKLRAERIGDTVEQVFVYDGSSLTLYSPHEGVYATKAAPPTIEDMLDFARDKLDIVAPAGDLVYEDAFSILMEDVTTAFVVDEGVVHGIRCDHLAFRNPSTDWQIWIQQGDEPLIRKMVITSADVIGQPEFRVTMNSWNLAPAFTDATFAFVPPKDAVAIDFLPVAAGDPSE